jgi:hypothetical protein
MATPTTALTFRPLSLGQLLDQSIRLYRHNFIKFIGIIAIVQIPTTLLQILSSTLAASDVLEGLSYADPGAIGEIYGPFFLRTMGLGALLLVFNFVLVQGVGTAALTRVIADSRMGENTGILQAYRKIGPAWIRILGSLLLLVVLCLALAIWTIVPCIGWISGPGMLIFITLVVIPMVAPVVVLESKTGFSAIRRAWELVRRRFWWIIGFVLILYLLGQVVISGPTALLNVVLSFATDQTDSLSQQTLRNAVIQSLSQLLLALLYQPLRLAAITLAYFDLRVRTEGLDLALQAQPIIQEDGSSAQILAQVPEGRSDSLLTSKEVGSFVLLSLGVVILYVVIIGILGAIMAIVGPLILPSGF